MRYFDKLLNFFASSYNNNTRFHHSTLGYLKIFFERNNKMKSTFAALGNVFRNSKWSDLKIQNIKTSFIKSWSSYAAFILFIAIFMCAFLGTYKGGIIITYVPLLGDIYEILCFSWTHFEDILKSASLVLLSVWFYLKSIVLRNLQLKQNHIHESLSASKNHVSRINDQVYTPTFLSKDELRNHMPIEVMYKLVHASKSVRTIDSSFGANLNNTKLHFDNIDISDWLLPINSKTLSSSNTTLNISNIEYAYTIATQKSTFTQQFDTNSLDLNKTSSYNPTLSLTNLNTQNALSNAKQDRWLLRNSLLSENLILNSNAFTQSKKLIGVNFLNSELTSRNVWSSTKLNSLNSASSSNFISNLQELFNNQPSSDNNSSNPNYTNPNLDNFNFFENSRMWLVKKYFFTNQLKNNLTQLTQTLVNSNVETIPTDNTRNFTVILSLYNQNPKTQLSYLTLHLHSAQLLNNSVPATSSYDFYLSSGDLDIFKSNNLSFLNKLTQSTSNRGFSYYTTLIGYNSVNSENTLYFKK